MNKLLLVIILGIFFSCKGKKSVTQIQHNQNNHQTSDSLYRFNISFISIGSGIDGNARKELLNFIKNFEAKRSLNIEMEIAKWGREGEIDYCLKLSQLNPDEQVEFILAVKELLKKSKLVRYAENTKCKNKRN